MSTHRTARSLRRGPVAAGLASVVILLAACGSDDDSTVGTTTTAADTATSAVAPVAEIEVTEAWARTSPAVAPAGAVYLNLSNTGDLDDALIGAAVDPSVAAVVELHETGQAREGEEDDAMTTTTGMGGGMMEMRPVEEISVPAGEVVALEPGGYHLMLLELAAPLEVGTTIDLTLTFAESGPIEVSADVRDMAP